MNNTRRRLLPAILLLVALTIIPIRAQTTLSASAIDPLLMLPASDVVLLIDHSRIWSEAIPRFFGADAAPIRKILAEAEQFKAKTGVDVRSISRIAVGVRFVNPEAVTKMKVDKKDLAVVIIAQGDFDPNKLVSAMRRDAKERVREEQHGGQIIYSVDESKGGNQQPDIEKVAVAVLDTNTIAIGDLVHVRATIDAKAGSGRLSPELVSLIQRNGSALASLAGNVPAALFASLLPKESSGNAEMDKQFGKFFEAVASIKQMYISLGMTATDVEASLGARLGSTEQAQSLGDMLLGARQQYSVFIEDKMIRDLVANMQITAEGEEVQLKAALPQTTIAMLISNASKTAAATTASAPKTTATQTATPTAQPKKKRKGTRRKKN
ncbi:MAG TPA: hypothetical protein VF658_20930 [Pyrinomonadaceae bacterium]|jgi:hypothetical protein